MIEAFRSLRWGDYFILAMTDPRALYRQIAKNDPAHFALGFAVPAAAAISEILAGSLIASQSGFFYYKITYGWILLYAGMVFRWVISAALMDLAAQFHGHRGNIRETITLVNFSLVPGLFILPVTIIFSVLRFAPVFFFVAGSMGLAVWSAVIASQGLAEMHQCSFGRALFIYLFPAIFTGTALFMMFILGIMCLGGLIAS